MFVKQCHKSACLYLIYDGYVFFRSGVPNLCNIKLRNAQNPLKVAYLNTTAKLLDIHCNMHSRGRDRESEAKFHGKENS